MRSKAPRPRTPRPPVPPDKAPSSPVETPPDQPGLPEDPEAPPEGDPPRRDPTRLVSPATGGGGRSLTSHILESLETGMVPHGEEPSVPEPEAGLVRMGDPDVDALQNEYAGDESPGASATTPDQNLIDATGRAYGVGSEESGALRTSAELLDRRDRRRAGPPKDRRRI